MNSLVKRAYSPEQLELMKKKCHELLKVGYNLPEPFVEMEHCPHSSFPRMALKDFGFTVDLLQVNAQTKKDERPMPHAESHSCNSLSP